MKQKRIACIHSDQSRGAVAQMLLAALYIVCHAIAAGCSLQDQEAGPSEGSHIGAKPLATHIALAFRMQEYGAMGFVMPTPDAPATIDDVFKTGIFVRSEQCLERVLIEIGVESAAYAFDVDAMLTPDAQVLFCEYAKVAGRERPWRIVDIFDCMPFVEEEASEGRNTRVFIKFRGQVHQNACLVLLYYGQRVLHPDHLLSYAHYYRSLAEALEHLGGVRGICLVDGSLQFPVEHEHAPGVGWMFEPWSADEVRFWHNVNGTEQNSEPFVW